MSDYKITVAGFENDDDQRTDMYKNGIDCDGFAMIAFTGEKPMVVAHHVNVDMLANAIAADNVLYAAAILGTARRNAADFLRTQDSKDKLRDMLAGIFEADEGDDD